MGGRGGGGGGGEETFEIGCVFKGTHSFLDSTVAMIIDVRLCTLQELPPYNGFGSLEDSKQSCLSLIPQPPKKDLMRMLENDGKVLRFAAILVGRYFSSLTQRSTMAHKSFKELPHIATTSLPRTLQGQKMKTGSLSYPTTCQMT